MQGDIMILVIDIGNTQTCVGAFENDSNELNGLWRFSTRDTITVDEVSHSIAKIFKHSNYKIEDMNEVCLSCVVPSLTVCYEKSISAFIRKNNLNTKFVICNAENAKALDQSIYNCKYPFPNEVGSDIIATSIGARALYKTPFVVIDFGTATTFNITNKNGEFLGGMISPGLKTSLNALLAEASALSDIELKAPKNLIGHNTDESIQSGIVIGEANRADGFIERIENEFGQKVNVICTGGWSKILHNLMNHDVI